MLIMFMIDVKVSNKRKFLCMYKLVNLCFFLLKIDRNYKSN